MFSEPLFTWVDVQAALDDSVKEWPESLFSARAYWDGVVIECESGEESKVAEWLAEYFGPRWEGRTGGGELRLESERQLPRRALSASIEGVEERPTPGLTRRSFRRPDVATRRELADLPTHQLHPAVFAWHSFKGGVGRTTTAIQFARLLARQSGGANKVLLLDMDFEAPGVTWMIAESRLPAPELSMADILALIHSSGPDELQDAYALIRARLRDSLVDGIVVVPALRSNQREPDVRPEHLETPGIQPLSDILAEIGRGMGITHVIADLRAGRSELAASLLLDRRVNRVLVTTPAGQSVKGTQEMLRDLASALPTADADPPITILANKLSTDAHTARSSMNDLRDRLQSAIDEVAPDSPEGTLRFTAAQFDINLLHLPLGWSESVGRLDLSSALNRIEASTDLTFDQFVDEFSTPTDIILPSKIDIHSARKMLHDYATSVEHAESTGQTDFLDAEFIKKLVLANRSRLPLAVVIGEKGAGKTFTFLRLVQSASWKEFASRTGAEVTKDGAVVPVLWPPSLLEQAERLIQSALGSDMHVAGLALQDSLQESLHSGGVNFDWRQWWLQWLALRAGMEYLPSRSEHIGAFAPRLFVVDGIEELLPNIHSSPTEQRCLQALIQHVPAWLKAANNGMGLLVFTRSDYVREAIRQNLSQFREQYRTYEMWWDRQEALRLVNWIAVHSGALGEGATDGTQESNLARLWGRRLGSGSRGTTVTEKWVHDAMSTRSEEYGSVHARDLVRLMAEAARLSQDSSDEDRLLTATALKEALSVVGRKKIDEIRQQNPNLFHALSRFRDEGSTLRVPFRASDLSEDQQAALTTLVSEGIAFTHDNESWLVPLYRRGLGLSLHPRRRERVLR